MEQKKIFKIHELWVNNKEGKISIAIDILNKKLIFYGKYKIKLENTTSWHILSKKEYDIVNNENNFEKACKEVYAEMNENLEMINGVQNFLKETTQIEIN